MSSAAPAAIASPCGLKMRAVGLEQVGALHPLRARARADEQRDVRAVERGLRVVEDVDAGQQRERAVEELERGALGRLDRLRDLEQVQVHRLVRAEQVPGGDAEQQRVADLAGGAGDGDLGGLGHREAFSSFSSESGDRQGYASIGSA